MNRTLSTPTQRILPCAAALVAAAVLLAACGSSSKSGKASGATSSGGESSRLAGKRLGISVCCPQPQIDIIANALTTNVKSNNTGLSATVVNGQASTQKAMQDVQTFLAQGYDAIWTTLISGQGYDTLAKQAAAKKIPWVNFSGSAVTGATLNIVIPETQLGYAVGTATAAWMIAHQDSTASVGATIDSSGANGARTTGFVAGVHAKLPNVKVYTVGNVATTTTAAAAIGANLLQAHPDIKVLFGWVADDGVGLLQAAKQAGNTDPNKFLVATDEGNTQVYDLIASKSPLQIGASLGYPFGAIEGEHLLEQALEGKAIPPTAIMRPTLVTPDNVALVQKEEANPNAYPARIKDQLAFTQDVLQFGQLPTEQVQPTTP